MTLTTAVTDGYRHATDRLIETNWTHAAGVYFATQLAASVWMFYLLVAFEDSHGSLSYTDINPGLHDGVVTGLIAAALVGAMVTPFVYAACWLVSRRWSNLRATAGGLWFLGGPVLFLELVGQRTRAIGAGDVLADIQAAPWELAHLLAVFAVSATLLALLVGGTYALTTGQVHPSRGQRRALLVVAVVLVAVPIGVGAAVPMDDGESYEPESYTDGSTDVPENTSETTDENDTSDDDAGYDAPNATDPEVYDNGRLSPYIESVEPLEGETDSVTTVAEPRPPTDNESVFSHPIAETHTDADVTISEVNATVRNGTVVPEARYHLDFEGVNTSAERVFGLWTYDSEVVTDAYDPATTAMVWHATRAEVETGLYLDMEQIESTHLYVDLVTDDGEIHRYVVALERTE